VYYAPTFFAALGQSYEMTLILSGMVNICQLVAGIPTFLYLDKMGRRKLAIIGGLLMATPHLIMSGIVNKYSSNWAAHQGMGWFGVALICKSMSSLFSVCRVSDLYEDIYVLAYACSYGPLAWT